jgi:hypothetical protein
MFDVPAVNPVRTPPTDVGRMYPPPLISNFESGEKPFHSGNMRLNAGVFSIEIASLWNFPERV